MLSSAFLVTVSGNGEGVCDIEGSCLGLTNRKLSWGYIEGNKAQQIVKFVLNKILLDIKE